MKNPHEKALAKMTHEVKHRARKVVKNMESLRSKGNKTHDIINKHS